MSTTTQRAEPSSGTPRGQGGHPQGGRSRRMRMRHPIRWLAGALLVALGVVAVVAATRPSFQATQVASPLVGRAAPPISGTGFDGRGVSLDAYRGRFVYVNFFASWCPPCASEQPDLVDFAYRQQHSPSGAALVSVDFDDSIASARAFVSKWGVRWPVLADDAGTVANAYGVTSPPMTFLVSPRGMVVGVWKGPVTTGQLDAMLAAARGQEAGRG